MNFEAKFTIIRSNRKTLSIELRPGEIIVRAPMYMEEAVINQFVESRKSWINTKLAMLNERQEALKDIKPYTKEEIKQFTAKAKLEIPKRVEFYAEKIGVTYNKINIKCQRGCWGTCSSKGNLNFNCLLVLLPDEVIDSVVVHELCHLKQMNHSPRFYAEVYKAFPNYEKCDLWLKQNGGAYINRIPR